MNAAVAASNHTQIAWRRSGLPLLVLLLAVLFLFRDTFLGMAQIWLRSETFTHGLFVLPISLWLIWRERAGLACLAPKPLPWMLLPMLGVAFLWVLGELVSVNSVTQLAATGLLVLSVFLILGWRVGGAMLFPLGFLFFAVPLGEFLMPQFMTWTADFTVQALRLVGIPVYREGLRFVIPSGNWSVVEACSGIRYLIASLVVGTLFAYLNYRTLWRRWVFVGVSIVVPVLANWMRAFLIVILGHVSGNALATGADHLIYGWVFFGIVMLLMFVIGARWREDDQPLVQPTVAEQQVVHAAAATSSPWAWAAGAAVLIGLAPTWMWHLNQPQADRPVVLRAPAVLAEGWHSVDSRPWVFKPAFQNPSAQADAWYQYDPQGVGVHWSYYRQQNAERKLVSSQNVLVNSHDADWTPLDSAVDTMATSSGELTFQWSELRSAQVAGVSHEHHLGVWQIYWVNGHWTSSAIWAKLYGAWGRLMGQPDDAAVLVLYAPRGPQGEGRAAMASFVRTNWPALEAHLRQTRDSVSGH